MHRDPRHAVSVEQHNSPKPQFHLRRIRELPPTRHDASKLSRRCNHRRCHSLPRKGQDPMHRDPRHAVLVEYNSPKMNFRVRRIRALPPTRYHRYMHPTRYDASKPSRRCNHRRCRSLPRKGRDPIQRYSRQPVFGHSPTNTKIQRQKQKSP